MKYKEIESRVNTLLNAGNSKQAVLEKLSGEGMKPAKVAYAIASYLDPERLAACRIHRKVLIGLSYVQLILAALIVGVAGGAVPVAFSVAMLAFVLVIGGVFTWGFTKNKARIYNAFIILGIVQSARALTHTGPTIADWVGLAISLALIGYVAFVRYKMFPDFAFTRPRRVRGQYVFVEKSH